MDENTLQFEEVTVKDDSNPNGKMFPNASIEVTPKEIYIGSRFKVKWKLVKELQIIEGKNDDDDDDNDNDDLIGFELRCFISKNDNNKKKSTDYFQSILSRRNENANDKEKEEEDEEGGIRVFEVFFPVTPPGSRDFVAAWDEFRGTLKRFYDKELKKRKKKQEREEKERQQQLEQKSKSSSYNPRRRTYSKRKSKYDNFLRKNKTNIENNAMTWSDDEDNGNDPMDEVTNKNHDEDGYNNDDDQMMDRFAPNKINNKATRKRFEEGVEEVEDIWKGRNDNNDKNGQDDDDGQNEDDDEDEYEFNDDDGIGGDDDDDDGDSFLNTKDRDAIKKESIKEELFKNKIDRDSEDDDDDEFIFNEKDGPFVTTPASGTQRIVSPTTTSMKKSQKKQSIRIIQDEKNSDEEPTNQKQRYVSEKSQTKNKMSSFFQPKTNSKTVVSNTSTKNTTYSWVDKSSKGVIIDSTTTALTKQQPRSAGKRRKPEDVNMDGNQDTNKSAEENIMGNGMVNSDHEDVESKNNKSNRKRVSKIGLNNLFSAQKRSRKQKAINVARPSMRTSPKSIKTLDAENELSTVVGSTQDDISDYDNEVGRKSSTISRYMTEQNKTNNLIVRNSERRVEDDDPIEEVVSSQSQSPLSPFSSSKRTINGIKFPHYSSGKRNKYGSRSALKALQFADTRGSTTSPRLLSKPYDETNGSSLSQVKKRLNLDTSREEQPASNKWRGLKNYGNSCYVNSSLQQLFSVPKFMESISKSKKGHALVTTLSNLWTSLMGRTDNIGSAPAALSRPVKEKIDQLTDRFRGSQQRDSHEFLGELIDRIHDELSGNEVNSNDNSNVMSPIASDSCESGGKSSQDAIVEPVDEFFRWNVEVSLKCKSCGYSRSKEEMYRYLSIDIGDGTFDLQDPNFIKPRVDLCLTSFFSAEDREINCEKCKGGKIATQTMKVLSKPKVMLLHLKRFFMVERQTTDKDNSPSSEIILKKNKVPVELTTKLSIDNLLANKPIGTSLSSKEYRLKSIVYHIGNTASSGHYTTDALRRDEGKDQWVSFDDGVTVEKSLDKVVETPKNQKTAYMLMYSID